MKLMCASILFFVYKRHKSVDWKVVVGKKADGTTTLKGRGGGTARARRMAASPCLSLNGNVTANHFLLLLLTWCSAFFLSFFLLLWLSMNVQNSSVR